MPSRPRKPEKAAKSGVAFPGRPEPGVGCPTYEGCLFTGRARVNLPAPTDTRLRNVSRRPSCSPYDVIDQNAVRERQRELCRQVLRGLSRLEARTGRTVDVTRRSLMEAAGWAVEGLTVRQAESKFGPQLDRTLRYLTDWGLVEAREALYEPNGEGRCIVVTLHAGVAQSVRASKFSHRRPSAAPPRRSFSGEVSGPLQGDIGGSGDSSLSRSERRERLPRASARASVDATVSVSLSSVRAALAAARLSVGLDGAEPTGARLLQAVPALAAAPPSLLARAAWAEAGHQDLRLSVAQREQLETAAGQLERAGYGVLPAGPAAAAAAIIDLAFGGWAEFWHVGDQDRGHDRADGKRPATPGALAICARRLAHRLLAGWRTRRRPTPPKPGAGRAHA